MHPFLMLALLLVAACARPAPGTPPLTSLAFTGVTVIDGTGEPPWADMTVVVVGDRIHAVGPAASVRLPRTAQVVDASGRYLIPGLWDAHVHLSLAGEGALPLFVAHGVTSVRDMGSRLADVHAWRSMVDAGSLVGPHIRSPGPILESARWLEAVRSFPMPVEFPLWELSPRIGVGTPAQAQAVVDSLAAAGADFIKLRTVASAEVFRSIAARSAQHGLRLAGHAPHGLRLPALSELGLSSLEHTEPTVFLLDTLSSAARFAAFQELAANGIGVVPTIIAEVNWRLVPDSVVWATIEDARGRHEPRRRQLSSTLIDFWRFQMATKQFESPLDWQALHEQGMEDLRAMHRAGVRMMAGTDVGAVLVFPGSSLHDELVLMAEKLGMAPMEILESATRNAAALLPHINQYGGTARQVQEAVRCLEELRHPLDVFARVAFAVGSIPGAGNAAKAQLDNQPVAVRLAMEMAAHEEAERRALEGELALLEQAWKEAERLASIADRLAVPPSVERVLQKLKEAAGGSTA